MRWGVEEEPATDTVRLTASSEAVWIEEDELRYECCMFDVREKQRIGNEAWLLIGHFDRADDEIFSLLDSLFGLGSGRGGQKRCAIFLPEAIVLQRAIRRLPRVNRAEPLHTLTPAEDWHSIPQKVSEHPPEIDV